jgi:hypothetical protein
MTDQERDELAQIIRKGLQKAGISSRHTAWDDLPEHRRQPHRIAAEVIYPAIKAWEAERERRAKADAAGA